MACKIFALHPNLERFLTPFSVQMIRVMTFDAAGTLIRLVHPPGKVYAERGLPFGYELDPVRLQNAFRTVWEKIPPPAEGVSQTDDDRDWWRVLVAQTMIEAGYRIDRFDDYFEAVYEQFRLPGVWGLFPDVQNVLFQLSRAGIRLGIISNFDRRLYDILADLGVRDRFEHLIISSEIGFRKPAAQIFEVALHRFGVQASEILHVGDEFDSDFAGARAAGFHAFLVNDKRTNLTKEITLLCGIANP